MHNDVFGEVTFNYGWKTDTEITLWGETYKIMVDAAAYFEDEEITVEQETAYTTINDQKPEKQSVIESLLSRYFNNNLNEEQFRERLKPTALVIEQEGKCAVLFDDEEDPDNGLAVIISPDEEVKTQDEYL
jgi:hypothetical protein